MIMLRNKEFITELSLTIVKTMIVVVASVIIVNIFKTKIDTISSTVKSQKMAAFALEKRGQTIRQLQSDFKLIGPGESMIENSTPEADNVVDVKSAIEGVGNRQGVRSAIDFSLPSADLSSIDYSLSLNFGVMPLIEYLRNFEKLPYITTIESIDIRSDQNSSWEGSATVGLRAKLFTVPVKDL